MQIKELKTAVYSCIGLAVVLTAIYGFGKYVWMPTLEILPLYMFAVLTTLAFAFVLSIPILLVLNNLDNNFPAYLNQVDVELASRYAFILLFWLILPFAIYAMERSDVAKELTEQHEKIVNQAEKQKQDDS